MLKSAGLREVDAQFRSDFEGIDIPPWAKWAVVSDREGQDPLDLFSQVESMHAMKDTAVRDLWHWQDELRKGN